MSNMLNLLSDKFNQNNQNKDDQNINSYQMLQDKIVGDIITDQSIRLQDVVISKGRASLANVNIEKVKEILDKLNKDGPYEIKALATAGGFIMVWSGFWGFFGRTLGFSVFMAILLLYELMFGMIVVALENKHKLMKVEWKIKLQQQAAFLFNIHGRGLFQVFVGLFCFGTYDGFLDIIAFLCMTISGVVLLQVAHVNKEKTQKLKNSLMNKDFVIQKFHEHDKDGNGNLSIPELSCLCKDLGCHMNHNELEGLLLQLDEDHSGEISIDEFLLWWGAKEE